MRGTQLKRVVPCLDVTAAGVVKGVRFQELRAVGDPVELAARYDGQGADELVFLDVSATRDGRRPLLDVLERVSRSVFLPVTAGGGVRDVETLRDMLLAGADKVAVNTAAVERPALLAEAADRFGAQCVVLAIDVRRRDVGWEVVSHAGTHPTGRDLLAWVAEAERLGAGELLLTSMDRDGTRDGYDLDLYRAVAAVSRLPLIASGGAGTVAHVAEVLNAGADAALLASLLHGGELTVGSLKDELARAGVAIRPSTAHVGEEVS